jgi:hypothetical protein
LDTNVSMLPAATMLPSGCTTMAPRSSPAGESMWTAPLEPNVGSGSPSAWNRATTRPPATTSLPSGCCTSAAGSPWTYVTNSPPAPQLVSAAPLAKKLANAKTDEPAPFDEPATTIRPLAVTTRLEGEKREPLPSEATPALPNAGSREPSGMSRTMEVGCPNRATTILPSLCCAMQAKQVCPGTTT